MNELRILFLGASRLVGLLERFQSAAKAEDVMISMISIEDSAPWHAVAAAGLAKVFTGPSFATSEFAEFLCSFVETHGVDIIIPTIDTATVALAALKPYLEEDGRTAVVSKLPLCKAMHDKLVAGKLFREHKINTPHGHIYPLLAKPRFGASSRGQFVFQDKAEFDFWNQRHHSENYVVQPLVKGTEYSIDAYVARSGHVVGAVSRVRVVVAGGEVMVTKTEHNPHVLSETQKLLAISGWQGPLVIQVIDAQEAAYLIECNPRFGSGAPCSIEAGLDMPRWIIREHLGRPLPTGPIDWKDGLCMTRSRKDHFLWLSS